MKEVVLITGCAKGMGHLAAISFAQKDWLVVATDLRTPDFSTYSAQAWAGNITPLKLDVTSPEDWHKAFDFIESHNLDLRVIVNNAGVLLSKYSENVTLKDVDFQLSVNVNGTLYGSTMAASYFVKRRKGHIINIASLAGIAAVPGLSLYCASKFAVRGYSIAAAYDLRKHGVYVTAICPDAVDTDMTKEHLNNDQAEMIFSGSMLKPDAVIKAIFEALKNKPIEIVIPRYRGWLGKIAMFFPNLGFAASRFFQKIGQKKQAQRRSAS